VRAIARRPDLELIGLWVHSEHKVGRDAGELAGGAPLGVVGATDLPLTVPYAAFD